MANKAGLALAFIAACGGGSTPHEPAYTCTSFETWFQSSSLDQIDLLLVVDNSPSMGDKAALLAAAVPDLLNRLVNHDCVDPQGCDNATTSFVLNRYSTSSS
jgi:hypothetical protein